jgi:putative heme-binding domain-containing protein
LLEFVPRRIVAVALENSAKASEAMNGLAGLLADADSAVRGDILSGMLEGAKGQKRMPEPTAWPEAYKRLATDGDEKVRAQARELALLFGSSAALEQLRAVLFNDKAVPEARREALAALIVQGDTTLLEPLLKLTGAEGPLRIDSLRALANYDEPRVSGILIAVYPKLSPAEQTAALTTLAARPAGISAMLAAIDANAIPKKDLTPQLARLIQGAKKPEFDQWLAANFGTLQPTNAERQAEITRYGKFLGEEAILHADVKNGREIFERTCAACHTMFGAGGKIGPELPGSFKDVGYLLQNILDPDAVIGRDYQQTFITTKDGKIVAGVVAAEDGASVTLRTLAESVTVPKMEITKRELSPQSMMPAGLLSGLEEPEVRDLFLYLRQSKNP